MKKLFCLILALVMVVCLVACGGSAATTTTAAPAASAETKTETAPAASTETAAAPAAAEPETRETYLTFKVGTSYGTGSAFYNGLLEFERLVEEGTKGAVQVEVLGDNALGTENEMSEGIAMGTVDACLIGSSSIAKLDSKFTVFSLPYLFANNDHVDAVFAGEPGQYFRDEIWNQAHVMVLDYWDSGFRHYSTNKCEINGPEDMAGQLIRVPNNKIQNATAAALGAATTTLDIKEVYLACSNGTIDGQEGPVFAMVNNSFYEVQKYMVMDGHIYAVMGVLMNGDVWEKLTPEDQQVVLDACYQGGLIEKNQIRSEEADQLQFLKDQGMIINEHPDNAAWREATAPVYDQFRDEFGADLIQQIIDTPY